MVDLEALLQREYQVKRRSSWWRAAICFAHLTAAFPGGFPIEDSYEASSAYVLERRGRGAADATIRNELLALSAALKLASNCGQIPARRDRPPLAIPYVGDRNARREFFRPKEFEHMRRLLPGVIGELARFSYLTGFRRGEVLRLTWDRIDRARGVIVLESADTKNREPRVWPFTRHPGLRRIVSDRYEARRGQYVFHRSGRPVRDFAWVWKKACRDSGLGRRFFHDLRRSAARNMVFSGVPTQIVIKLMGWKSEAMLRRYCILDELDLADQVAHYARNGEPRNGDKAKAPHDRV